MPVRSQRRVGPELDRRAFDLQRVGGLRLDTLELAGDVAALQQRARDLREERRLGRPTAERAASSLTTTEVTTNTPSANQLRESCSVNVCVGGRK